MQVHCPHCGHNAVIVCYAAPIGGWYYDEVLEKNIPRIRCARCERAISPAEPEAVHVPDGTVLN